MKKCLIFKQRVLSISSAQNANGLSKCRHSVATGWVSQK